MSRSVTQLFSFATVLGIALGVSGMAAAETQDLLKQGDPIGPFYVTKAAGAADDGVEEGEELCYRCRYGSRPMVMVFARRTGGKVAELVEQIDIAVADNEEAHFKGLLTLLGDDAGALKAAATKFVESASVKRVPVVIAKETKTGPSNYKLSPEADVTVVLASDSQVIETHTFEADSIDIKVVMKTVTRMLN